MIKLITLFFAALTLSIAGHSFVLDTNTYMVSDGFDETNSSYSRFAGDISIGMRLVEDNMWSIAANLSSLNTSDQESGNTQRWSTFDYGLKVIGYLNRIKTWGFGFAYNLAANGEYSDATQSKKWRGTSVKMDVGYTPLVFHKVYFGVRLNYYLAQYTEESTDGGSTYLNQKVGRNLLYPSIFLSFRSF